MASRRKGRILAFQALYSWEATGRGTGAAAPVPKELLDFSWLETDKRENLDQATVDFSRLLVTGTIQNIDSIDQAIRAHLQNWDFSRLNRVDLALLRMSTYTLMFQTDVLPSIVIDEAIGISKEFGTGESFRFVNGVLDSIRRTLESSRTLESAQTSEGAQTPPELRKPPVSQAAGPPE
ncbi:MAG: transcription antitermination factor NusB [Spirochaetaceae bacterium]|jgi:N utilization substance protein B|nr:transcription antitermination factor NusB [Spirochaetaceae bacterium]